MDAVEYLKAETRMCNNGRNCEGCKYGKVRDDFKLKSCTELVRTRPHIAVSIVEEWSKAHPKQTRRDKFKEVFGKPPTAKVNCFIGCIEGVESDWWDAPYEAPKGDNNG